MRDGGVTTLSSEPGSERHVLHGWLYLAVLSDSTKPTDVEEDVLVDDEMKKFLEIAEGWLKLLQHLLAFCDARRFGTLVKMARILCSGPSPRGRVRRRWQRRRGLTCVVTTSMCTLTSFGLHITG